MEEAFRPEQYQGAVSDLKADQRQAQKLKAGTFPYYYRSHNSLDKCLALMFYSCLAIIKKM